MLKNTKAQGMSVKIIIVAIIGLIILAVVVMMLTGKLGDFGVGIKSVGDPTKLCDGQLEGSALKDPVNGNCPATHPVQILSRDSGTEGKKCCML